MDKQELDWMLWRIDSSQRSDPPELNIIRAVQYYTEKYGEVPNRCEVASTWAPDLSPPDGFLLTRSKAVRPEHILLALDSSLNTALPIKRMGE